MIFLSDNFCNELCPFSSDSEVCKITYLHFKLLKAETRYVGVGPLRAKMLVDHFGQGILDVMDMCDAAERIAEAAKCKPNIAADIKQSWLKSRTSCEHPLCITPPPQIPHPTPSHSHFPSYPPMLTPSKFTFSLPKDHF